jgi:hypothetical protein
MGLIGRACRKMCENGVFHCNGKGEGAKVLVYEPSVMGSKRFVLLADGSVEVWKDDELRKALIDE